MKWEALEYESTFSSWRRLHTLARREGVLQGGELHQLALSAQVEGSIRRKGKDRALPPAEEPLAEGPLPLARPARSHLNHAQYGGEVHNARAHIAVGVGRGREEAQHLLDFLQGTGKGGE